MTDKKTQGHKDSGTQRHKKTKTRGQKDTGTKRHGNKKTRGHKDTGTQRHRDKKTQGHKDTGGTQRHRRDTKTQEEIIRQEILKTSKAFLYHGATDIPSMLFIFYSLLSMKI